MLPDGYQLKVWILGTLPIKDLLILKNKELFMGTPIGQNALLRDSLLS